MKEEKFEELLKRVRAMKQGNHANPVSEMNDEELQLRLTLLGYDGGHGMLSPEEIASVRKAVSMEV